MTHLGAFVSFEMFFGPSWVFFYRAHTVWFVLQFDRSSNLNTSRFTPRQEAAFSAAAGFPNERGAQ